MYSQSSSFAAYWSLLLVRLCEKSLNRTVERPMAAASEQTRVRGTGTSCPDALKRLLIRVSFCRAVSFAVASMISSMVTLASS